MEMANDMRSKGDIYAAISIEKDVMWDSGLTEVMNEIDAVHDELPE